jgi:serine/threonine-protein kinase
MQPRTVGPGHRYVTSRLLASDRLGTLWRGRDARTGAPVLVRLLDDRLPASGGRVRHGLVRIGGLRGERAGAHLAVAIDHGLDRAGGEPAFVVYEGFSGDALASRLERGEAAPPAWALRVVGAVADALARAHAVWVFHGSLGASSVLVDGDAVRVTDVGVGELLLDAGAGGTASNTSLTDRGGADVLAVATLFEAMTRWPGAPPASPGRSPEEEGDEARGWEDDVPAEAAEALRRALSPYRLLRPSMADLAAALAPARALPAPPGPALAPLAVAAGPSVAPPATSPSERDEPPAVRPGAGRASRAPASAPAARPRPSARRPIAGGRRRRLIAPAIAALALVVAAASVVVLRSSAGPDRGRRPPAPQPASISPVSAIERATVPPVLGKTFDRAIAALDRAGLVLGDVVPVPGPEGVVARSEPTQGEAVAAGVEVDLFVGDGSER